MGKVEFKSILENFQAKLPALLAEVELIASQIVNTGSRRLPRGVQSYRHEWMRWHLMRLAMENGFEAFPEQPFGHPMKKKGKSHTGRLDLVWWIGEPGHFAKAFPLISWEIDNRGRPLMNIYKLIQFPAPIGIHILLCHTVSTGKRAQIVKQLGPDDKVWIAPTWNELATAGVYPADVNT